MELPEVPGSPEPEAFVEALGPVLVVGHDEDQLVVGRARELGGAGDKRAGEPAAARLGHGVDILHLRAGALRPELADRHQRAVAAAHSEQPISQRTPLAPSLVDELLDLARRRAVLAVPAPD